MSDNLDRLAYRSSPQAIRFAWKTILLALAFGSFFFILIPLTAKIEKPEEKTLTVRSLPQRAPIIKKEKVYEEKQTEPKKKKVDIEKVIPPRAVPPKQVKSVPINMKLSMMSSPVTLIVNKSIKTDFNFKVEKIHAISAENTTKKRVVAAPPTKISPLNYNGIFNEDQVDQSARRIRYQPPVYPMRARRRNISGTVIISCIISKEGKVTSPVIKSSSPKGYFEKNCLEILDNLLYEPAVKDGRKVAQRLILNFNFGLKE